MQPRMEIIEKLPEEVTIPELVGEIQQYLSKSTSILFAQTSHYWRSYYYRQQLEEACLNNDFYAQRRLLTNLIIHHSLLTENSCQQDWRSWLPYLKKYRNDETVSHGNQLLAHALQLILNPNFDRRLWDEWVIRLNWVCLNSKELGYSLLKLVVSAMGNKIEMTNLDNSLKDKLITIFSKNNKYDVFDWKIHLAVYAQEIITNLEEIVELIISVYKASAKDPTNKYNFISILHALIQLLPVQHHFWLNKKEGIIKVIGYLSVIDVYDDEFSKKLGINFQEILIKLILMLFRVNSLEAHEYESWQGSILHSAESPPHESIITAWQIALEIYALQDDAMRLAWLKKHLSYSAWNDSLRAFAYNISAQLASDEARREAIIHFYECYWLFNNNDDSSPLSLFTLGNCIIDILKVLLTRQSNSKEKNQLLQQMYIAFQGERESYSVDRHKRLIVLLSSLSDEDLFLPGINADIEKIEQDHREWRSNQEAYSFPDFCTTLKTPEHIKSSIARLRQLLDKDFLNNCSFLVTRGYVALLRKQPDLELWLELQEKILQHYQNREVDYFCHELLIVVNVGLLFIKSKEAQVKFMDIFLRKFQHYPSLIIKMFIIIPLELKQTYSSILTKLLSSEDIAAICGGYNLASYARLLPHLTDDSIASLAEKYSLLSLLPSKAYKT